MHFEMTQRHAMNPSMLFSTLALVMVPTLSCASPTQDPVTWPIGADAEVVQLASGMGFLEGPVWLPKEDQLVFSDIPNAKLMQWSESGGLGVFRDSPNPNGNLLDAKGRLLTCRHGARDIVRTEHDGSLTVLASHYDGRRLNSPNDLALRADGSLWFTDPPWGLPQQSVGREQPWNGVYRLDPRSGAVALVLPYHAMPNGIAFSPGGKVLYVADTGGHPAHPDPKTHQLPASVTAYRVQANGELNPEALWQTQTRCDGMALDPAGNLYTTSGEGIVVLDPAGAILHTIPIPEGPANCCFGGADGRTLFVTARTSMYAIPGPMQGT